MKKNIIPILFLALLYSCNNNPGTRQKDTDSTKSISKTDTVFSANNYFKFIADSVVIPSVEIDLQLSDKAEQKLKAIKETIIVRADFSGVPKDTTLEDDMGAMGIISSEQELTASRIAKFEGLKFSKKLYDSIANKNLQLLINIFSGRRSYKDNLLNCDILEDSLSNISGKKYTLKCKLIAE